jgi:catechol 2,3-dioxygenase-like lactoylglutathione lyase family enzyme
MADETIWRELSPVIPARDMAAMLAFYTEQLGFTRVFDDATAPGAVPGYAGVARGGFCLHLQSTAPGEDPTMPQIRIRVENIGPLHDEYAARDLVAPSGPLREMDWGTREFGLYDPERSALVFYEDLLSERDRSGGATP